MQTHYIFVYALLTVGGQQVNDGGGKQKASACACEDARGDGCFLCFFHGMYVSFLCFQKEHGQKTDVSFVFCGKITKSPCKNRNFAVS